MQALPRCAWHRVAMDRKRKTGRGFHGIMSYGRGSVGSGGQTQEGAELSQTAYLCREQHRWGELAIGKVLVAKTRISPGLMATVGRLARASGVNISWPWAKGAQDCAVQTVAPPFLLVPPHHASFSWLRADFLNRSAGQKKAATTVSAGNRCKFSILHAASRQSVGPAPNLN